MSPPKEIPKVELPKRAVAGIIIAIHISSERKLAAELFEGRQSDITFVLPKSDQQRLMTVRQKAIYTREQYCMPIEIVPQVILWVASDVTVGDLLERLKELKEEYFAILDQLTEKAQKENYDQQLLHIAELLREEAKELDSESSKARQLYTKANRLESLADTVREGFRHHYSFRWSLYKLDLSMDILDVIKDEKVRKLVEGDIAEERKRYVGQMMAHLYEALNEVVARLLDNVSKEKMHPKTVESIKTNLERVRSLNIFEDQRIVARTNELEMMLEANLESLKKELEKIRKEQKQLATAYERSRFEFV